MKRTVKKMSLHRETLHNLSPVEMEGAAAGIQVVVFTQSCLVSACLTCGCPTRVQNCTTHC
jgi:hypothetical protein